MKIKIIKWLCLNSFLILKYVFYSYFILICILYKIGHIPVIIGYLFWYLCGQYIGALIYKNVMSFIKTHKDYFQ